MTKENETKIESGFFTKIGKAIKTFYVKFIKPKNNFLTGLFIFCLVVYPLAQWATFWLYPNIRTFVLPFMDWDFWEGQYIPAEGGPFYNFKTQIDEFLKVSPVTNTHGLLWNCFFNTFHSLWINLIILPIALIIGFALAKHVPGEKFFRVVFFTPNIISTVVMCLAFRFMTEANDALLVGPVAKILRSDFFKALGVNYNGWDLTDSSTIWTLIYIYCIWTGLSINVVLISGAFQRIPAEIIESARLDGVTFMGEFAKISLPLIMPTVTTFLVNSVIAVTGFYMQPFLLLGTMGENGKFGTIPWLIFDLTTNANDPSGFILVATIGILFSLLIFPVIALARYIGMKLTPDVEF